MNGPNQVTVTVDQNGITVDRQKVWGESDGQIRFAIRNRTNELQKVRIPPVESPVGGLGRRCDSISAGIRPLRG